MKFRYTVPDYEHSGDIDHAISEIKQICPEVTNINSWEEEDFEAEVDYEDEYGECEEAIYQGYIEFEAPDTYKQALKDYDCYPIKG